MTKLEIPEGYSKTISVGTVPNDIGKHTAYLVSTGEECNSETISLLILAPAMAEEIKRLRERVSMLELEATTQQVISSEMHKIAELVRTQDNRMTSHPIFMVQEKIGQTWRNVQPCFTEEGANQYIRMDGHNLLQPRVYVASGYRNLEWQLVRAFFLNLKPDAALAKPQGAQEASGFEKPYVPVATAMGAEPSLTRRPFDLEAALRGEKVVTRYGRHVTNLRRNHGHQDDCALIGEVEGVGVMHWRENGRHGYIHDSDGDLFMEGGV